VARYERDAVKTDIFVISDRGLGLASKIAGGLKDARIRGPGLRGAALARAVATAFRGADALVFVSAVGIAVRLTAPFFKSKVTDPAVVSVDEAGRFAVSLLSGHLGGANALARRIARVIGATPVVTTATDSAGLACIEDVAERFSLAIADARGIKKVNSAILDGGRVFIVAEDAGLRSALRDVFGGAAPFRIRKTFPAALKGRDVVVHITPFIRRAGAALTLVPAEFVAGIGCGRGVGAGEIGRAFESVLRAGRISRLAVRNIATIDIKRDERGLARFAERMGLDIEFFSSEGLNRVAAPSGASDMVLSKTGAAAVSEPAAMLSARARRIWTKKRKSGRVSVALARIRVRYS